MSFLFWLTEHVPINKQDLILRPAQGAVCTGVWVIAHECGHQSFSKWQNVNDAVGLLLHTALLVPYYSWYVTQQVFVPISLSTKKNCANILLGRAKHAWCTTPSMPYSNPRAQYCHDSIFFASAGSTHTEGIIPIPEVQRRTRLRFSQPASEHMHCVSPEFFRGPLLGHFLCAVAQESCQIPAWLLLWSKRS